MPNHDSFNNQCSELTLSGRQIDALAAVKDRQDISGSEIYLRYLFPLNYHLKRNPGTSMCYVTNAGRAQSNGCLIFPRVYSHVSQGQAAIKDVSGLSMKTGRAMLLQIVTIGESQAIQCTMRSHRSPNSQKFASAKPVIDICQRKRVVHVSSKAAGRWREAGGHA